MNDETPQHDSASEQLGRDDAEWQAWFDEFGLQAPPKFRNESLATPVDEKLLRTPLRRKLPEYKVRAILILVVSYRSWVISHSANLCELERFVFEVTHHRHGRVKAAPAVRWVNQRCASSRKTSRKTSVFPTSLLALCMILHSKPSASTLTISGAALAFRFRL